MTDTNMHYLSGIPREFVTSWVREINEYEMQYKNELFARNYLPNREIGETIDYDSVTYYDTVDGHAQLIAKGAVPNPFTARARTQTYEVIQLAETFAINGRDLAKPDGAAMKTKEVDIAVRKIHRAEDDFAINGYLNNNGIVDAARANTNGKIAASAGTYNNNGAWDGTDTSRDIYEDINLARTLMDSSFKPAYLVGNRVSLSYMDTMDSERQLFSETVAKLFGKKPEDRSWMVESQYVPSGYVYLIPYDPQAMEFVISEEIDIKDDYGKTLGEVYNILINEWIVPIEVHVNESAVEICIT